jgi:3-oxoacyl-[acyl-carrier protein] reductase
VPDLIINNAGVVVRKPLDELSESEWDHVVDANLKGTFNVTRVFLPQMKARGSGRIINVASISGRQGTARLTAYCAAKHGVVGLTRALAEELRPAGLQVNAICPGSVDTEMLAGSGFPPMMEPGDVAGVALWLAEGAPAALTGACVDVFG